MDMEEPNPNAATAQGDLADVVARANAMPAVASTRRAPPPPATNMPPPHPQYYYPTSSQIMSPAAYEIEDERRVPMFEAPSTVDPYLPSSAMAAYGLPQHHQQHQQMAAQISQHVYCGHDALMGGFGAGAADDGDDAMRISPLTPAAHHQMIKRKNEVKKVVCIPAPPATSGRAGGEVIPSDLWAWRKYGQKPIKGSPYPRGYYRCSSSKGCMARKQVERSRSDPNMLVVTYTAEHNHPWPMQRNVLAGYARAHTAATHASPKNKQQKITGRSSADVVAVSAAAAGSSSSSSARNHSPASGQNAIGFTGDLDGHLPANIMAATTGVGEGGLMYDPASFHPDEVFAELEELEPHNSLNNNANIYSKGVSYDQWHNRF